MGNVVPLSYGEDGEPSHVVGMSYNPLLPFQDSEWHATLMDHICVLSLFT